MSALGQKRTCACTRLCPLCAKSGLTHRNILHPYSITSLARVSSVGGAVRPSMVADCGPKRVHFTFSHIRVLMLILPSV